MINRIIISISIIVHLLNYSPTIVKVIVLPLLGPSNSIKNTDCQVPKSSFEFLTGKDSLEDIELFSDFPIKSCCVLKLL